MRITLDTNVLVGGHDGAASQSRSILLSVLRGGHKLVLSQPMLYELEEVLHYPRVQSLYALSAESIERYLAFLIRVSEIVDIGPPIELPLTDRDDWAVLRTAIEGNVQVVCSHDGGFHTMKVAAFCAQYEIRVVRPAELQKMLAT